MNINASIIDQRIVGLHEEFQQELAGLVGEEQQRQKSLAFVLLCVSSLLDIPAALAMELLTDGRGDLGIDALHLSEVDDGEFTVTLFQGKYKHRDLTGNANFPENDIRKAITLIQSVFNPDAALTMNERLKPRIEEVRSLIRDGYIPNVRMVLCNNGKQWSSEAQQWIQQSGLMHQQVQWLHYNHDNIVQTLHSGQKVNDEIQLVGKAIIEDFNFRRVLVGKVPVTEIAALFDRNGDQLLEKNIRRYLGRNANRVNQAIYTTLVDPQKQKDFYFYNNGITMTCTKLRHNALQGDNYRLKLDNIQIINGGQTCKTIQQTLAEHEGEQSFDDVYVLLRLYELEGNDDGLVHDITFATNSQNPVDLRDLRSNDELQIQLETGIKDLGFNYKRHRDDVSVDAKSFTSATTAEAVMAVWRQCPHQSKFRRRELFGALYEKVFEGLTPAQAILAVLIFRAVETERKRPQILQPAPNFLPYAAHYLAMLVGELLLAQTANELATVTHQNISELHQYLNDNKAQLIERAAQQLAQALKEIYGERELTLQQLSATFRRGDLLEYLPN